MELKAKTISLIIKILDVAFVITCAVLKWCGLFTNISIGEICAVAGIIAAIFGDVSLNTTFDKFVNNGIKDDSN